MPRPRALLVVACVLLAGCSGGSAPTVATPTDDSTASKTLSEPLYRLELRSRDHGLVSVTIELTHVDNESVFYEKSTTLPSDAVRDYSSEVPESEPFRATISTRNASRTFVVGPDEGYSVWVHNESELSVYERNST